MTIAPVWLNRYAFNRNIENISMRWPNAICETIVSKCLFSMVFCIQFEFWRSATTFVRTFILVQNGFCLGEPFICDVGTALRQNTSIEWTAALATP